MPIVAKSRAQAEEEREFLETLVPEQVGIDLVSSWAGVDLSAYPIDGPLPPLPDVSTYNGQRTNLESLEAFAKENLTIREIARRISNAGTGPIMAGTPMEIADEMEAWYVSGAADGFNLMFPLLPKDWLNFAELVVPELQRRGLTRKEYAAGTLRDRLGLPRPANRFSSQLASTDGRATPARSRACRRTSNMNVVVSVNVGLPRDVEWQGKTVRTAIWKEPVRGRVRAERLNLAGDRQADLAGHGGEHRAVMVYQLASYDYWEKYLHRSDFVYGNFGENFTVEGLPDDEVCIGDRFRIGSAIFEISQPRVTCYRVGLRLNQPAMPSLLVSHRRPGFYFRVIQEGEVGAGDRIEQIAAGPEQMTVADMDALLYSSHHPVEALRRAIRIAALSPGWQSSIRALLDAAEKGEDTGNAGLSPTPLFRSFGAAFDRSKLLPQPRRVSTSDPSNSRPVDGSPLPTPLPGQYVIVRVRPGLDSPPVARNYSLCGAPIAGTYKIAVKNEGGLASGFLHEHVRAGDLLEVGAPRGSFTLDPGTAPVVLLSAGVGITPMVAMLHAAASDGDLSREIWWFHSARDNAHDAFATQVRSLMGELKSGHLCTIYSRPGADHPPGVEYDVQGRLTVALLQRMSVPRTGDFYLCGPPGFLADLVEGLKAWPVDPSRIHTEVFGPSSSLAPGVAGSTNQAPRLPLGSPGNGPSVTFLRSGVAPRWDTRFHSLLELAEACSVPVRWSCRTGVCHTCESGVIDGRLRYSPDPLDPPPEGTALICCATPTSDITLDL